MVEIEHPPTFPIAIVQRSTLALTEEAGLMFPRTAVRTSQPLEVKMLFNPRAAGFVA